MLKVVFRLYATEIMKYYTKLILEGNICIKTSIETKMSQTDISPA